MGIPMSKDKKECVQVTFAIRSFQLPVCESSVEFQPCYYARYELKEYSSTKSYSVRIESCWSNFQKQSICQTTLLLKNAWCLFTDTDNSNFKSPLSYKKHKKLEFSHFYSQLFPCAKSDKANTYVFEMDKGGSNQPELISGSSHLRIQSPYLIFTIFILQSSHDKNLEKSSVFISSFCQKLCLHLLHT